MLCGDSHRQCIITFATMYNNKQVNALVSDLSRINLHIDSEVPSGIRTATILFLGKGTDLILDVYWDIAHQVEM